jgi:hypothetical protein
MCPHYTSLLIYSSLLNVRDGFVSYLLRLQILTALTMKMRVFCDAEHCSLVETDVSEVTIASIVIGAKET